MPALDLSNRVLKAQVKLVSSITFDPTMIVQLGIQVYTGDPPPGMITLAGPITVVFEIDTITY